MSDLEELKRLHKAATPGEWFATDWQRPSGTFTPTLVATKEEAGSDLESCACDCDHAEHPIENAAWIAAIHNAFPAILARLEAAQRLRDAIAAQHCNGACAGNGKSIMVRNALAAFDKEQQ